MPPHIVALVKIFLFSGLAFVLVFVLMPLFLDFLYRFRLGKNIREHSMDGRVAHIFQALHLKKQGTPTMGGLLVWLVILAVILISRFFSYLGIIDQSLLDRGEVYLPLVTLVTVGILGAVDDYLNIRGIGALKGMSSKIKMIFLLVFSALGAYWFYFKLGYDSIHVPGVGDFSIGLWYIPLFIFIIVASSNAVNITDGLDGLASGLLIIAFGAFGVLAFMQGHPVLAGFCTIVAAALGAFLWFNIPPAKLFMGDTGALAFGATLGVIAMMTDSLLVLPLIGFIFVLETLTVLLQLFWKRVFKKKLFSIAPFHHLLEHVGWPEHSVVMRLWIIGAGVAGIGLLIGLVGMGVKSVL